LQAGKTNKGKKSNAKGTSHTQEVRASFHLDCRPAQQSQPALQQVSQGRPTYLQVWQESLHLVLILYCISDSTSRTIVLHFASQH